MLKLDLHHFLLWHVTNLSHCVTSSLFDSVDKSFRRKLSKPVKISSTYCKVCGFIGKSFYKVTAGYRHFNHELFLFVYSKTSLPNFAWPENVTPK